MQNKNEVVAALLTEIEQQSYRLSSQPIDTIYFGGGTPSLLTAGELNSLLEKLRFHFIIPENAEITLEANPDDIQAGLLADWKQAGVNRLSIGVQSFRDQDLVWMNRAHSANEAMKAIELAKQAGFNNLTIDLIYGTPGLSDEAWAGNLEIARELDIPHLSCYALTIEPATALFHKVATNKMADTDPIQQARQFLQLMEFAEAAGYDHYEVSNFARPGWQSRHNSSYWKGVQYLGLGPGAHSYDGVYRRWNVSNNTLYVNGINKGLPIQEEELLSVHNRFNEYVMTSLRTMEGINLSRIRAINGDDYAKELVRKVQRYVELEQVWVTEDSIRLTKTGKLYADGIAADLFAD